MGAAASMPAARAGAWEAGIPHATRVTRLYRASLRTSRDWLIDREVWLVDAARIQKAFHSQKGLSVAAGRVLADRAAETLIEHRHPEPYVPIYMEGGRYVGGGCYPVLILLILLVRMVRAGGGGPACVGALVWGKCHWSMRAHFCGRSALCTSLALVCGWAEERGQTLYACYRQREGEGM